MKIFRSPLLILLFSIIFTFCNSDSHKRKNQLEGDYIGQELPKDGPALFEEGIVSTKFNVRDAAFSPHGDEFYYSIKGPEVYSIICLRRTDGIWQNPEVASFSGKYSDIEPCFYPDGRKLFFVSNRPMDGKSEPKDYDIWYVEKEGNNWGKPQNLGSPINTEANEFYPSFSKDGTIYFCAKHENSFGGEDLYYSKLKRGDYQVPINLGDSINSSRDEFNSFVSPDESFIMFTSTGWGNGFGGGDLWISFRKDDEGWSRPKNMGEKVNSTDFEYCPSLSPDGKYLFFTSNRSAQNRYSIKTLSYSDIINGLNSTLNGSQNIYLMDARFIKALR